MESQDQKQSYIVKLVKDEFMFSQVYRMSCLHQRVCMFAHVQILHLHSPVNKHSNLVQICHLQADGCSAVEVSDSGADEGMINMENGLVNASLCRALVLSDDNDMTVTSSSIANQKSDVNMNEERESLRQVDMEEKTVCLVVHQI